MPRAAPRRPEKAQAKQRTRKRQDDAPPAATPPTEPEVSDEILRALRMEPGAASALPPLLEELDPDAAWVRASGQTPLEFLVFTYRNVWQRASDRISAAKAVLEYAHKRLPNELKLQGDPAAPLLGRLGPADLSKLNDGELQTLTKLIEKMNTNDA